MIENKSSKLSVICDIGQKLDFKHKEPVIVELLINRNIPGIYVRKYQKDVDDKEICELSYFHKDQ